MPTLTWQAPPNFPPTFRRAELHLHPVRPSRFQQTTGTLRYLDGSLPQSDADSDWWNMVYRWTDCPVLAGLIWAITLLMLCRAKAAPVRS